MIPSRQRLEPGNGAGVRRQLRLKMCADLSFVQRKLQLLAQRVTVCAVAMPPDRATRAVARSSFFIVCLPCRIFTLALQDAFDGDTVVGEDLFDGRLDVLGTDRRERRQVVGLQKRVVHAHGWHLG